MASDELAKKHACFACHTLDKKMVGPSYKDVAAKYRSRQGGGAEARHKVKNGSQASGARYRCRPTAVPDADIKTLVKWILSQK